MKAEELRLENLVVIDNELLSETKGGIFVITGIQRRVEKDFPDSDSVISLIPYARSWRNYNQFNEFIKPIPLTEEWLLKSEYNGKSSIPNEINVYGRFLFVWKENYKYWYVVTIDSLEYLTKIEFVHEYQNFIFALTQTELEIK